MDRVCRSVGIMRNAYKILVRKPEGNTPLVTARCRQEDNIRMDLREGSSEGVDWMHLAQDRDKWQAAENITVNLWVA
jgi:hypothetical protein